MTKIQWVLWDWNGTIVNDAPLSCDVLNRMILKRNLSEITLERYREIYEHPIEKIYERSGFDLVAEPYDGLSNEWHDDYIRCLKDVPLHCDVIETLETIRNAGISQSVLSALPHDILTDSVAKHQLGSYFEEVLGLNDRAGVSKIDNGHKLMKLLDAVPAKTVIIGDSSHDFETATALGIGCCLVARGFEDKLRLSKHNQEVFDDFAQVVERLGL